MAGPRERLWTPQLELLDIAAAQAEREDRLDEAGRLLYEAIGIEPYDEVRYERLARLLVTRGRIGSARAMLTRARQTLAGIGVTPPVDADDLIAVVVRRR